MCYNYEYKIRCKSEYLRNYSPTPLQQGPASSPEALRAVLPGVPSATAQQTQESRKVAVAGQWGPLGSPAAR